MIMVRKFGLILLILSLFIFLMAPGILANSLWDDSGSMFSDNKAVEEGDILTVLITEDATASQQAATDASQDNQAEIGAGTGILDFINAFGYEQSDSTSADGSTTRSGDLTAEMTVQIMEVLENGNLKVNGTKRLRINDETQEIELTGIIRPEDISPDNTIESNYVADADISYDGQGVIGDRQQEGIISRIISWIF